MHWVMHLDVRGWVYALGYAFRCAGLGFMHWVMHLDVQGWGYALGYAFSCAGLGLYI